MGKPEKAVVIHYESRLGQVKIAAADPGAMNSRAKGSLPFRIRLLTNDGVPSFAWAIHPPKNRAAHRNDGARPIEPPDYRTCGLHSANPGIGGRHGEESFFEVLAVPFV